ncbi:major type 1 subunit fimbrin (pilin) [Serratia fonticola]|uniref:Major type 1 subunit fimbrin (Pilin) n=1 Tax=Serratia fonticola TaxID=47917 RepID=A0A542BK50_SERFO|nr:fimbrial protein [Serratia fonticola]TQI78960.1 major type 1 subunit fimbrin (pilin) [Serratia fonticola]TQI99018.1 major type 1 subunit fimbrin (pilin) [Serratia fonticola]TVZ68543.1 major type 1 subunit fimbrin (pilin) [Serratia fonticola]
MKKLAIVASLVAAFGSVGMAQAASTGTITFNGELTANTCDVIVDGQTADATVVLPTVGVKQLDEAAKTAGDTGFVMALNNCQGTLETASAFFEAGASVDAVTGRLKNLSGTASNVSLQLLDGSSSSQAVIEAGNQNQVLKTTYKDVTGGSTTLPYIVRYYAENATTAGTVISNVVYSIQYQ